MTLENSILSPLEQLDLLVELRCCVDPKKVDELLTKIGYNMDDYNGRTLLLNKVMGIATSLGSHSSEYQRYEETKYYLTTQDWKI
ncbi:MAG: hypothetical protein FWE44_06125 [Defluviitaleaceae bacterium]|nr:hypothetical protein [Defluviitaleaceae bacterium]